MNAKVRFRALKALYARFKALYAKHFKAVEPSNPDSFGNIIDKCLAMVNDIEQAQTTLNSNRATLVSLAASIKDCNILKKIEELAAEAEPVEQKSAETFDKDADMMFG